ncbi:MAG: GNAT family N-acetyltransferase [Pseudomonadota bacterium]|nr:GNAT family N-acetyltransferase [Pseudomonadota bacterium]
MALELSQAETGEASQVRALARDAYAIYVPRMGREPAPMLADYENLIAAGRVTVLRDNGRLVGFLVAYPRGKNLHVENVAVAVAARGRGLGKLLLDEAERIAGEAGLRALELYTNEKMTENIAWYPRLGFRETGRRIEDGYARVYFLKELD